jgi:hypothetical protein
MAEARIRTSFEAARLRPWCSGDALKAASSSGGYLFRGSPNAFMAFW